MNSLWPDWRATVALAACLAATGAAAQDIVRCKDARGAVTYQPAPCPDRTEQSRPQIPASYPEPNKAERQHIFEREAALDKRLEARRDRELQEQQMREARAEREAERRHREILAAQAEPQYVIAYPAWRRHAPASPPRHLPRYSLPPIR
ncbi:MAG TPA: DUF4124 domain-containing protein [Usitatibacter sp.]|nr:DUF4124 domain-containing protein [Usitatibacter sp.]